MQTRYALDNPLSRILDKPASDFTRQDLVRVIEEREIERITFRYVALDGKLKELMIPVSGRAQAERILAEGERVDGSSLFKGMVDVSVSDLYVVPVYRTAFLNPFDEGSLDFLCRYLTKDGILAPFAIDSILSRAAGLLRRSTGLDLHALGELEFFLLSDRTSPLYPSVAQRGYHSAGPFLKSGPVLTEMLHHITRITGAVKYAHAEVGAMGSIRSDLEEIRDKQAEQLEIEFLPMPLEEAGDALVLARWIIRTTAFRRGCVATFTPKIEEGIAGNGMHVHMALMDGTRNVMTAPDASLSQEALRVIGGLCTYADSLTAFGNTVSSAYLRLVPNQEAPTRICWSDMNRSAMIRVPLGWRGTTNLAGQLNPQQQAPFEDAGPRQTVELRSPDGSALVHLLLAGIAMAAEWGLRSGEAPSIAERHYVSGNIFRDDALLASLPCLPHSCVESARILREKRTLYEREGIFPPSTIDYIVKMLDAEND